MKYLVLTGNEDDNLDTDVGYKGFIQFVIAVQRAGGTLGDAMIEADSNGNEDAVPRQNVRLSNFTFISRVLTNADAGAILLRGGTDYTAVNGVLVTAAGLPCLRLNAPAVLQAADPAKDELGAPKFNSVVFSGCTTPFSGTGGPTNADVAAAFNAGTNNNSAFTSTLTSLFINGTGETAVTPFNAATLNDTTAYFINTPYIGAVRNAADTWYQNWTCNSATANFGGTGGLCTTLPTN